MSFAAARPFSSISRRFRARPGSRTRVLANTLANTLLWALLCASICALAVGCSKGESDEGPVDDMPPPVSEAEQRRGEEACKAYVARVCACAESRPDDADMRERCDVAPGKLSSLNMVLRVNRAPENAEDRVKTSTTAHRIIGSCIAEQSKLDSLGCPRTNAP